MRSRYLFIPIILLICCSSEVTYDEVIGTYSMEYPYGIEILHLAGDSTYVQHVFIYDGAESRSNTGRWVFREESSEVDLCNAMLIDDNFGDLKPSYWEIGEGYRILRVEKRLGKVSLRWNDDLGYMFRKRD